MPSPRICRSTGSAANPLAALLRRGALLAVAAAAPLPLLAQYVAGGGNGFTFSRPQIGLSIRGGYDRPSASSDIFDFTTRNLTLNKGDFAAASFVADVYLRTHDRVEWMASLGTAVRNAPSEFRDFIDNNDQPIEQTTQLRRTPVSVGVRVALASPGERIGKLAWIPNRFTPWVGGGGGVMHFSFKQTGDWVNQQTLDVFSDTFNSEGWAPMAYGQAGADFRLTTRLALTGDVRYHYARGNLNGTFEGFDKIDLAGASATLGLTVRY